MRKFVLVGGIFLLCAVLVGTTARNTKYGEWLPEPIGPPAKSVEVTKVVFNNGAKYDDKVPKSLNPLTRAVSETCPNATFKVEGNQLMVGVSFEDTPRGEILSVVWQSDCPVNSQYRYSQPEAFAAKVLRPTLVAWTQLRHEHLGLGKAGVQNYSQAEGRAEVTLIRQ